MMNGEKTREVVKLAVTLCICMSLCVNFCRSPMAVFETKIIALDHELGDKYGASVSISGDYAIVGAHKDNDGGSESGSVYIYFRNEASWYQQAKLTASDASAAAWFGHSVSISGDYAIVGALDYNDTSGSAYIYFRNGDSWNEQAKLISDVAEYVRFGISVSISGDYAIVGAPWDWGDGSKSGSAYIFLRNETSWNQQAKLTTSNAAASYFGWSVSISGDYAIVGALLDDDGGIDSGSAYIFFRNETSSWNQQAKLKASDATEYDFFGHSVSISGDYAIIGSYLDDDGAIQAGSAYIFLRNDSDWNQQVKLTASDAYAYNNFGFSVSISGDYAIVGSRKSGDSGTYLFVRNGSNWTQQSKLPVSTIYGEYYSVSISGDYAIVGAYKNLESAYIYKLEWYECPLSNECNGNGKCIYQDVCECETGYKGSEPTNCINFSCDTINCGSHGVCVGPNKCLCNIGWDRNSNCNVLDCRKLNDCSSHGVCYYRDYRENTCICNNGWNGNLNCSVFDCHELNNCSSHGECEGPNTCACNPGFSGSACKIDLNLNLLSGMIVLGISLGVVAVGVIAVVLVLFIIVFVLKKQKEKLNKIEDNDQVELITKESTTVFDVEKDKKVTEKDKMIVEVEKDKEMELKENEKE